MANKLFCNDPLLAAKISGEFPLKTENVASMIDMYEHLIKIIPYQYLAHIIRTIEEYVRQYVQGADFFRITCKPIKDNKKIQGLASATYQKPYSFDIVYDDSMPEIKKRVCIAHELGHLLVSIKPDRNYNIAPHEPLSSVYGILITLHKKYCKDVQKTSQSTDEIIKDFKNML